MTMRGFRGDVPNNPTPFCFHNTHKDVTMNFMALLALAGKLISLLPFPDWSDAAAVRAWVLSALDVADGIADTTATERDDKALDAARAIVANEAAFMAFYGVVIDLVTDGTADDMESRVASAAALAGGEETKLDPVTIIAIITAIVQLIQAWRNRKA